MKTTFAHYLSLLCPAKSRVLLTVSGGVDSVVMAHLMASSGISFGMAHCNFGLRAAESDADEAFVAELAKELNVPFFIKKFDTKTFAEGQKITIQEAARKLRYEWFADMAWQHQYTHIATAHHADDATETLFINLIRGTGLAGIKGISAKRDNIIRPLLQYTKADIIAYATAHNIAYRTDSSNLTDKYLRNNLRLNILPKINDITQAASGIEVSKQHLNADLELMQALISDFAQKNISTSNTGKSIEIVHLFPYLLMPSFLPYLLGNYGITYNNAPSLQKMITNATSGKLLKFDNYTFYIYDGALWIIKNKAERAYNEYFIHEIPLNLKHQGVALTFRTIAEKTYKPKSEKTIQIDAYKLIFPLTLRQWQAADKMKPMGNTFYKKISDVIINQKIPVFERKNLMVLQNGNGEIIWLVGHKQSNDFKVNGGDEKILEIEYSANDFKLIIISPEKDVEGDHEIVNDLFYNGLETLHLRKPEYSEQEMEAYILKLNPHYYSKIVLHSHPHLVVRYKLKGFHYTTEAQKTLLPNTKIHSASVHTVAELRTLAPIAEYVFLSPIFDSISKENHPSKFDINTIEYLTHAHENIIALGGINADNVSVLKEKGFYGAAVLGHIWEEPKEALNRFVVLQQNTQNNNL